MIKTELRPSTVAITLLCFFAPLAGVELFGSSGAAAGYALGGTVLYWIAPALPREPNGSFGILRTASLAQGVKIIGVVYVLLALVQALHR